MIPLHDENETVRTPVVTFALIGINALVWFFVQGAGSEPALAASVCNLGLIPGELTLQAQPGEGFILDARRGLQCLTDPGRAPEHVFTSMFLHGSWAHIIGNMWFLWLFGNNVEDSMGRGRFVAFYLLSGVGAALAQVFSDPGSIIPMVGASGAISGVMGAYILLFPHARVFNLVPLGFFITSVGPGNGANLGGGVAFWAHAGGFVVGLAIVKLFVQPQYLEEHRRRHWRPKSRGLRGSRWG